MAFQDVLAQAIDWLQREQRLSYRALKRQFDLDDGCLEDLKEELTDGIPNGIFVAPLRPHASAGGRDACAGDKYRDSGNCSENAYVFLPRLGSDTSEDSEAGR